VPESSANSSIRFGVFEANLRAAELRKNGHKVKLQDQPFQLLAMLLEQPGEVVTREQLRNRLWPIDTFVDFDHGLNAAVKRLRDALGDSAENPRFVETLSRRGYRFIAPVNVIAPPSTPQNPITPPPLGAPAAAPSKARAYSRAALAVFLLLIGNGVGWVAARRFNPAARISELRLTANSPDDPILGAVLSPDAKYLAFADRSGLFVRIIASGETHSVTLPEGFKPQPAGWFPDGDHLLVTRTTGSDGSPSLWSVSVLGGAPKMLVDDASARSVSPDGSQIAFVRGEVLHQEIWVASADGAHPHKVFGDLGDMIGPVAWSPDGQLLAFMRFTYWAGFKDARASLWIVDPHGRSVRNVLSDPHLGEALAWAPGNRLVYSLSEPLPNQGDSNLWAVTIDPRNARTLGRPVQLTSGPDKKLRISLSADGKELTFLRWRGEPHVYVAEFDATHGLLAPPHALSLDEGRNLPFAWTSDGRTVLFTSDRDGPVHVFKQLADQPAPDLLVGGSESVTSARLNSDGSLLLYLLAPSLGATSNLARLMSVPVSGGTPRLVLQESGIHNFQCARLPSKTCILSRTTVDDTAFFTFDPLTGKMQPLAGAEHVPGGTHNWSFSPDGSMLALADWRKGQIPAEIVVRSLRQGTSRTLSLSDWAGISSIDWAADGHSLWVGAVDPSGVQALLNVDLRAHVKPLLRDAQRDVGWAIPSPDGRHIAFWEASGSSNAWLLRGWLSRDF
jgi:DNA-binding winged helix-turn-helix (wHTH) protein/Tol biopolymer transport system component